MSEITIKIKHEQLNERKKCEDLLIKSMVSVMFLSAQDARGKYGPNSFILRALYSAIDRTKRS